MEVAHPWTAFAMMAACAAGWLALVHAPMPTKTAFVMMQMTFVIPTGQRSFAMRYHQTADRGPCRWSFRAVSQMIACLGKSVPPGAHQSRDAVTIPTVTRESGATLVAVYLVFVPRSSHPYVGPMA